MTASTRKVVVYDNANEKHRAIEAGETVNVNNIPLSLITDNLIKVVNGKLTLSILDLLNLRDGTMPPTPVYPLDTRNYVDAIAVTDDGLYQDVITSDIDCSILPLLDDPDNLLRIKDGSLYVDEQELHDVMNPPTEIIFEFSLTQQEFDAYPKNDQGEAVVTVFNLSSANNRGYVKHAGVWRSATNPNYVGLSASINVPAPNTTQQVSAVLCSGSAIGYESYQFYVTKLVMHKLKMNSATEVRNIFERISELTLAPDFELEALNLKITRNLFSSANTYNSYLTINGIRSDLFYKCPNLESLQGAFRRAIYTGATVKAPSLKKCPKLTNVSEMYDEASMNIIISSDYISANADLTQTYNMFLRSNIGHLDWIDFSNNIKIINICNMYDNAAITKSIPVGFLDPLVALEDFSGLFQNNPGIIGDVNNLFTGPVPPTITRVGYAFSGCGQVSGVGMTLINKIIAINPNVYIAGFVKNCIHLDDYAAIPSIYK